MIRTHLHVRMAEDGLDANGLKYELLKFVRLDIFQTFKRR